MPDPGTPAPAAAAPLPDADPDRADPAGTLPGMVVIAQVIGAGAGLAALVAGSGWLSALLVHMAIGSATLLGSAVVASQADPVRRSLRPAVALARAGRRLTLSV